MTPFELGILLHYYVSPEDCRAYTERVPIWDETKDKLMSAQRGEGVAMEDREVVDAMARFGGSFVKALAECFRRADATNFQILKASFPNYWSAYTQEALRAKERAGPSDGATEEP